MVILIILYIKICELEIYPYLEGKLIFLLGLVTKLSIKGNSELLSVFEVSSLTLLLLLTCKEVASVFGLDVFICS